MLSENPRHASRLNLREAATALGNFIQVFLNLRALSETSVAASDVPCADRGFDRRQVTTG